MIRTFVILNALLLVPLAALHAAESKPVRPNVIIILAADQGYGDLACTGNPILETPNMDRLPREGRRFTDGKTRAASFDSWRLQSGTALRSRNAVFTSARSKANNSA